MQHASLPCPSPTSRACSKVAWIWLAAPPVNYWLGDLGQVPLCSVPLLPHLWNADSDTAYVITYFWILVAQLVKNLPAMQETLVWFLGYEKIPWRRDRLPTPIFVGFPGGSAGKESACNEADLGSIPGLGRSPGEGKGLPTPVFWPGEFNGLYSPWGLKESDMTERLKERNLSWSFKDFSEICCNVPFSLLILSLFSFFHG